MNIILFPPLPFKKHNNFNFPSKVLKNIKKNLKFITLLAKKKSFPNLNLMLEFMVFINFLIDPIFLIDFLITFGKVILDLRIIYN